MAPETWPLPTISRAHPPVTSTNYSAASDEGRRRFPQPVVWGPIDHCIPRSRSPCSPLPRPFCDVLGAPLPAMSINRWHPGIGRGLHRGRPLRQQSNSDHAGKRYILGQNRESQARPSNCNSRPGSAISQKLTSLVLSCK